MFGRFGTSLFGATEFLKRLIYKSRRVACVGDVATHPGSITVSAQDGTVFAGGAEVAVSGAIFTCGIHGPSSITPIIKKTYINGKLIVTEGAIVGCGAIIKPPNRGVYAG